MDDETIFLVNRTTDAGTRFQRSKGLPHKYRGQRVLRLFGKDIRPSRRVPFKRAFLLQHKADLVVLERQGLIGFQYTDMSWTSISQEFPRRVGPFVQTLLNTEQGAIPMRGTIPLHNVPPPEGGFAWEYPKARTGASSKELLDSLQRSLQEGLIQRMPGEEALLGRPEVRPDELESKKEAPPSADALLDSLSQITSRLREKQPPPEPEVKGPPPLPPEIDTSPERPAIPPPDFRKRPPIAENPVVADPFADEDYL